jgi:hypothetical protein
MRHEPITGAPNEQASSWKREAIHERDYEFDAVIHKSRTIEEKGSIIGQPLSFFLKRRRRRLYPAERGHTMKGKHLITFAALLLFAAAVRADDVQGPVTDTSLVGKLHAPGESISYNFFVESFEINGFGEAILNGTFTDRGAGLPPRTTTFSADYFFFGAKETDVLVQFGRSTTWDLMATTDRAFITETPHSAAALSAVSTPEPSTLLLLLPTLGFALFRIRRLIR